MSGLMKSQKNILINVVHIRSIKDPLADVVEDDRTDLRQKSSIDFGVPVLNEAHPAAPFGPFFVIEIQ